jgi:hypothetical protein
MNGWTALAVATAVFVVIAFGPLQWYYTSVGAAEARAAEQARLHEAVRKCGNGSVTYIEVKSGSVLCVGKWLNAEGKQ